MRRKTPADYHTLAEQRGFRWLGPEAANVATRTTWECGQGHRWHASYGNLYLGRGCPYCAGVVHKTPDDYRALAEARGLRWLGPEVANVDTKTTWACDQGHHWDTDYDRIRAGTGCPHCAGTARKTPDDYRVLAEERGLRWLGPEVPNFHTKTVWECDNGHRWQADYRSVRRRTGCPYCARLAPQSPDR